MIKHRLRRLLSATALTAVICAQSVAALARDQAGVFSMPGFGAFTPAVSGPTRVTYYAESLGESTWSTNTSFQNKVTVNFTPNANKTYVIFYSCLLNGSSINACEVRLHDGTNTLNNPVRIVKDTTDYVCMSGFSIASFGASPSAQTYTLDYRTSNTATTVKIQQGRLTVLELGANDFSATADGPTTITDTNFVTGLTMTQTFANSEDYYVFACAEIGTTSTTPTMEVNAQYDGGSSIGTCVHDFVSVNDWIPWCHVFKITGDGTSNSIIIRGRSSSTVDVEFQRFRLVAFKKADFAATFYDESRGRSTTTLASYQDKVTSTHTPAAAEHILAGCGIIDGNSTSSSFFAQLLEGATSIGEHIHEPSTAAESGGSMSYCMIYRKTLAASSLTLKTQFKVENAGDTAGLKESAVLWLQTG